MCFFFFQVFFWGEKFKKMAGGYPTIKKLIQELAERAWRRAAIEVLIVSDSSAKGTSSGQALLRLLQGKFR